MENRKEYIHKMVNKLTVLESKIQKLESLTDEVVNEVKSAYQEQIKALYLKKEEAQQELLRMREIDNRSEN